MPVAIAICERSVTNLHGELLDRDPDRERRPALDYLHGVTRPCGHRGTFRNAGRLTGRLPTLDAARRSRIAAPRNCPAVRMGTIRRRQQGVRRPRYAAASPSAIAA
jgi:hypothetical protein